MTADLAGQIRTICLAPLFPYRMQINLPFDEQSEELPQPSDHAPDKTA